MPVGALAGCKGGLEKPLEGTPLPVEALDGAFSAKAEGRGSSWGEIGIPLLIGGPWVVGGTVKKAGLLLGASWWVDRSGYWEGGC